MDWSSSTFGVFIVNFSDIRITLLNCAIRHCSAWSDSTGGPGFMYIIAHADKFMF